MKRILGIAMVLGLVGCTKENSQQSKTEKETEALVAA